MDQRAVCLCLLFLLSLASLIHDSQSSKLKALSIAGKAVRGLKKFKKLTPILLLVRKKPIIVVIKKNCPHQPLIPDLGLGGNVFAGYDWTQGFHSFPHAEYFPHDFH